MNSDHAYLEQMETGSNQEAMMNVARIKPWIEDKLLIVGIATVYSRAAWTLCEAILGFQGGFYLIVYPANPRLHIHTIYAALTIRAGNSTACGIIRYLNVSRMFSPTPAHRDLETDDA